jgi:hypothetical protein
MEDPPTIEDGYQRDRSASRENEDDRFAADENGHNNESNVNYSESRRNRDNEVDDDQQDSENVNNLYVTNLSFQVISFSTTIYRNM